MVSCSSFCVYLNRSVLLSVCYVFALPMCCWYLLKNRYIDNHQKIINLTLSTFIPIAQKDLTTPEVRRCLLVHECLVFASPLVVLRVNPLFTFLMFLHACVGCAMVFCLKVNWGASQLSQCNLCFAFWRLFWCSSRVLLCFNASAWMYMLSFVLPYILLRPASFLVLCICSAS